VDYTHVTRRAAEFVSRSIDLGEDTLALYQMRDQMSDRTAQVAINHLEELLSPRRAMLVRAQLDQANLKKATGNLSLWELYLIGQKYSSIKLAESKLAELITEPGALGALARIVEAQAVYSKAEIREALRTEINQFGTSAATSSGLHRLNL